MSARANPDSTSLIRAFQFEAEECDGLFGSFHHPTIQSSGETTNSGADQYTCFGTIVNVEAKLCGTNDLGLYHQMLKANVEPIPVIQTGDYFTLECHGNQFARLNKGLCRALYQLVTRRCFNVVAFITGRDGRPTVRHDDPPLPVLLVEINIYGMRADAEDVGRILSESNTFLQLPRYGLDWAEYHNPHLLRVSGFSEQRIMEIPLPPATGVAHYLDRNIENEFLANDSSTVVDHILNSLSHHSIQRELRVDDRIKSILLPHQMEAIDFIFQREIGPVPSDLSLWKYNDVDADEPFYQHVFSGAKRPQQEETKGGIIADEMGLGKSLVTLSIIAGSLDRAEEFFNAQKQLYSSQSTKKAPSKATLIVAPSSLLIDNWVDEVRKHTYPGGFSFYKYLGSGRHTETDLLHKQAIVFTTYATLATEFCRHKNTLAGINWFRIVLDEAHNIRNRFTKQFQAVVSLSAQHHWCLTGTPIQNKLDDLGALVSFVKVPILQNSAAFRKFITTPITSPSNASYKNLQTLLCTICLRRTREILNLPEPIPEIRKVSFTPAETAEYKSLLLQCRTELDMEVSGRRKSKLSALLETLLKLRLYCNNGSRELVLENGSTNLPADPDEALTYLQQQDQNVCSYCNGTIYSISGAAETDGGRFISSCCHLVCRNCVPSHIFGKERCPTCASGTEPTFLVTPSLNGTQLEPQGQFKGNSHHDLETYPSKLRAMLSDLLKFPTQKSIVFSCWKKTLGIVAKLLRSQAVPYDMIDGSLSLNDRVKVLRDFRSPHGANILLMTLGTGAVGLNLAVATRIYLLEPQWNPYIESQAIGRALRLGQTAQVAIVRYIVTNTVEESNVLYRQRTKLQLVDGGFSKENKKLSESLQQLLLGNP